MAITIADFDQCASVPTLLEAIPVKRKKNVCFYLENVLLLLHQSMDSVTLYEETGRRSYPVFNRNWANNVTPWLMKDAKRFVDRWKEADGYLRDQRFWTYIEMNGTEGGFDFSDDNVRLTARVSDHLKGGIRLTIDNWNCQIQSDSVPLPMCHGSIEDKAKLAQRMFRLPQYRRATLKRETNQIVEQVEYPCWLLDSIACCFSD